MTKITCPYCFEVFEDSDVHFRVPSVKKEDTSMLPDRFESIDDIRDDKRLDAASKKKIIDEYEQKNQFCAQKDDKYTKFWEDYGGSSEVTESIDGFAPYLRRVINPKNPKDKALLKIQDANDKSLDSYFIRDNGIVSEIQLKNGDVCSQRVCPHCHNPLPIHYGANPVKYITLIGISGSGKTVYLSQFLKELGSELTKVGYVVPAHTRTLTKYIEDNRIAVGTPLPSATPAISFQQPIVCECSKNREKTSIVLYDVAGELFGNGKYATQENIDKFARYIKHSDAIMLLIDPLQFDDFHNNGNSQDVPTAAITTIYTLLGERGQSVPFAVCISKADKIYDLMSPTEMVDMLTSEYEGIPDEDNNFRMKPVYNASQYTGYGEKLATFVNVHNQGIDQILSNDFNDYAYFAVSALGCGVDDSNGYSTPIGPIAPKRLMDPFYWIMYKLNMLEANGGVYNPNSPKCVNPDCGKKTTYKLSEPVDYSERVFLKKIFHTCTHHCGSCGCDFNLDEKWYTVNG